MTHILALFVSRARLAVIPASLALAVNDATISPIVAGDRLPANFATAALLREGNVRPFGQLKSSDPDSLPTSVFSSRAPASRVPTDKARLHSRLPRHDFQVRCQGKARVTNQSQPPEPVR